MHLALTAQGSAGVDLPAPFLVQQYSDGTVAGSIRRNAVGIAVATVLHAILLVLVLHAVSQSSPPIIPPQPYITVSMVTPTVDKPAPTPSPEPTKTPKPKQVKPTVQPKPRPTPQTRTDSPPVLTSAATASNPVEAVAPAAPPPPAPAPTPAPAREAPVAVVAPRFDAAYLSNPAPEYPRLSRRLGEEGRVMLQVRVSAEGKPLEVNIAKSSGFPRLDEIARDTVLRNWRFVPARQGDKAVAGTVRVPIDFSLTS